MMKLQLLNPSPPPPPAAAAAAAPSTTRCPRRGPKSGRSGRSATGRHGRSSSAGRDVHGAANMAGWGATYVANWDGTDDMMFTIYNYPLVNVYMTMERSTIFNGKTHYFYGHF